MKFKKLLFVSLSILFAAGTFFSCDDDDLDPLNEKGEVIFSFSNTILKNKSLKESESIDEAAIILISIRNADDEMIYSLEQFPLFNINGSFITKPISLLLGDYELTQFIVADSQGNALFIAPIVGAPNAYLVDVPLPITFIVAKDEVSKIVPEVIIADNGTPEDFGYSTFSFNVVETFNFLLSVFVYDSLIDNFKPTTANLNVTAEGKTLYSGHLENITNTISIRDGYDNYIINVVKDEYQSFIDTIINEQLKLHYSSEDNGPLIVVLDELDCDCPPTLTDIDGNIYSTVQIGDQCWMAENLRVTKYADGTSLVNGSGVLDITGDFTTKYYFAYNDDESYVETYGRLYTWAAVMNGSISEMAQGICPDGWHVPTIDEFEQSIEDLNDINFGGENYAGMRGAGGWYGLLGRATQLWTSNEYNSDVANAYQTDNLQNGLFLFNKTNTKADAFSIRCIKD
jgi:uncharacterized protein (TIGR02145 family)